MCLLHTVAGLAATVHYTVYVFGKSIPLGMKEKSYLFRGISDTELCTNKSCAPSAILRRLLHNRENLHHSRVRAVDGAAVATDGQAPVTAQFAGALVSTFCFPFVPAQFLKVYSVLFKACHSDSFLIIGRYVCFPLPARG